MPYATNPSTNSFDAAHQLPQHLDHKPFFAVPYPAFDGIYSGGTDVEYLSVGIAQYDPDDISVKTMRHTGTKWTRQAEELPLHRPIDMALLVALAVFDEQNGSVHVPKGTFQNQTTDIDLTKEQRNIGETASYNAALARHKGVLKDRLNALRNVLNDLKTSGKI